MTQREGFCVPGIDSTAVESEITVRFRKALAERGVPPAGADALLKRLRDTARASRMGKLSDEQACAKIALLLVATEEKAAELRHAVVAPVARDIAAGRLTMTEARGAQTVRLKSDPTIVESGHEWAEKLSQEVA